MPSRLPVKTKKGLGSLLPWVSYSATPGGITSPRWSKTSWQKPLSITLEYILPHRIEWLSGNGSAYTSRATCEFAIPVGITLCTTHHITVLNQMAWQSPLWRPSRGSMYTTHILPDARTVMELLPSWFGGYNEYHPHKGLKMKTPREHRRQALR